MAVWELLGAVRRHLVILLVGGVVSLAALAGIHRHPGLFQGEVQVILSPPHGYYVKNPLWGSDYNLIATGGVVMDMANENAQVAPTASPAVTLAGRGETDGYVVNLPNVGGQWAPNYDRAILDVQAVGRSQDRAEANLQEALTAIRTSLSSLQDQAGVPVGEQITASVQTPVMGWGRGRPSRSMLAAAGLGVGITLTVIFVVDGRTATRRRRVPRVRLSPSPSRLQPTV